MLGYLSADILFREANSFPRAKLEENCELRGTDNVQGQISEHIFAAKLRLLVVFSVTPFKIDQNKKSKSFNRLSPESGNRKKVDMQRLSPRFRSQQFFLWKICGETFFPNL